MLESGKSWFVLMSQRWQPFREVPWKRLWMFAAAVFLLFTVIGFFNDLMALGKIPPLIVLVIAFGCGLDALLWIIAMRHLPPVAVVGMIALQFAVSPVLSWIATWMSTHLTLAAASPDFGVRFAGASILVVTMTSYALFVSYIRAEGRESGRIRNELALAHGIQKTLVPPIALRNQAFEVYGVSHPSHKVGGDLVDAVLLPGGDMVAYLADIAGHGLPAGILMGMLKTAARTALLDAGSSEPESTLPLLMEKLNRILPQVKEPQMYATLTAFRLNADGRAWYAMAASPPVIHWSPHSESLQLVEEAQFPLGLLPVSGFTGEAIPVRPGDLILVATDGVLEVCDQRQQEFGVEPLKAIVETDGRGRLTDLAETILTRVRQFGTQSDDQTLLLIRRH